MLRAKTFSTECHELVDDVDRWRNRLTVSVVSNVLLTVRTCRDCREISPKNEGFRDSREIFN